MSTDPSFTALQRFVRLQGHSHRTGRSASKPAHVKGFGCRPIATVGQAPGPASESLQGRNPRVVGGRGRRECYGDFAVVGWWPDRDERRRAGWGGLVMGRGCSARPGWAL